MNILFIINDAPYGSEKAYNAFRLAMMLQKEHAANTGVRVFLMADAVTCALPGQKNAGWFLQPRTHAEKLDQ